jgi:hypothetical protein
VHFSSVIYDPLNLNVCCRQKANIKLKLRGISTAINYLPKKYQQFEQEENFAAFSLSLENYALFNFCLFFNEKKNQSYLIIITYSSPAICSIIAKTTPKAS